MNGEMFLKRLLTDEWTMKIATHKAVMCEKNRLWSKSQIAMLCDFCDYCLSCFNLDWCHSLLSKINAFKKCKFRGKRIELITDRQTTHISNDSIKIDIELLRSNYHLFPVLQDYVDGVKLTPKVACDNCLVQLFVLKSHNSIMVVKCFYQKPCKNLSIKEI